VARRVGAVEAIEDAPLVFGAESRTLVPRGAYRSAFERRLLIARINMVSSAHTQRSPSGLTRIAICSTMPRSSASSSK
jgi:hypothetical protein